MMRLANSTVNMMFYMTDKIQKPFVCKEFVERMAQIIGHYIDKMVGPSAVAELKVRDPEKYGFRPRILLSEIIGVLIHLSSSLEFLEYIGKDERSYKPAVWAKATRTVRKKQILSVRDCAKFEQIVNQINQLAASATETEEILGDVPDKFLDPIMSTLMSDPVTLPVSKAVVDEATIKRHLLNNPNDPFNRSPLTFDMVVPNLELKAEIEAWKAQKKAEALAKKLQSASASAVPSTERKDDDDDEDEEMLEAKAMSLSQGKSES